MAIMASHPRNSSLQPALTRVNCDSGMWRYAIFFSGGSHAIASQRTFDQTLF
jgi:hypothetical protein